jgi:hypothetical protein
VFRGQAAVFAHTGRIICICSLVGLVARSASRMIDGWPTRDALVTRTGAATSVAVGRGVHRQRHPAWRGPFTWMTVYIDQS